jgi:hypothetical protein
MHENFSNAIRNWEIGELKKQDIRNITNEEELFASKRACAFNLNAFPVPLINLMICSNKTEH